MASLATPQYGCVSEHHGIAPMRLGEDVAAPTLRCDPGKPTIAVVLGNTRTEATDFLAPYAMFAESEAYNVLAHEEAPPDGLEHPRSKRRDPLAWYAAAAGEGHQGTGGSG
jgi:hypothetical protein